MYLEEKTGIVLLSVSAVDLTFAEKCREGRIDIKFKQSSYWCAAGMVKFLACSRPTKK